MFAYIIHSVLGFEPESGGGVASTKNTLRGTKQIKVGLNTMAGSRNIFWRLGKAFQNQIVDIRIPQSVSYFGVSGFDHLEALRIVGKISFHSRAHPTGTKVAAGLSQRNC